METSQYILGEEAESNLVFTNITAEERRQYAAVVEKCEEFFQVRKNIIHKYTFLRFYSHSQN